MTTRTTHLRALLALLVAAAVAAGVLVLVGTAKPAEAAFPGDNGKISFTSVRDGDNEIFAMKPDGTGIEQLTDNTADDYNSAWSADGCWIAYTSTQDHALGEIYKTPYGCGFLVGPPVRLTNNTAGDGGPAFNHDTSKIAFASDRDGNPEIYVMDTADSNSDGNGDNQTNLTNNPAVDLGPAFSPDGSKIAFASYRDGNQEIYVMNVDGSDQTNLTNNAASDFRPNWSPDGSKIAFASDRDGNYNIYVMDADPNTDDAGRLTKNAANDFSPAWSPDGTKIAFTSFRGGDHEIYVMKAKPESRKNRPKNLTKNDNVNDFGPDWQPIE